MLSLVLCLCVQVRRFSHAQLRREGRRNARAGEVSPGEARGAVAAFDAAVAAGDGAVRGPDGSMLDEAVVRSARRLLAEVDGE